MKTTVNRYEQTVEIKNLDKAFSYFLILISLLLVMKTVFF